MERVCACVCDVGGSGGGVGGNPIWLTVAWRTIRD